MRQQPTKLSNVGSNPSGHAKTNYVPVRTDLRHESSKLVGTVQLRTGMPKASYDAFSFVRLSSKHMHNFEE